MELWISLVFY